MADVTVSGSFDSRGITTGMERVEKGTKRLSRSTRRSGMAFLEATRALEDFQFAGIRGAANNLPGLAMALGLGTGIAGLTTVAALGMVHLTKAMKRFEEQAMASANAAKAFGASLMRSIETIRNQRAIRGLAEELQAVQAAAKDAGERGAGADLLTGAQKVANAVEREIQLEMELARLRGEKVSEADRFTNEAKAADNAANIYGQAIDRMAAKRTKLEAQLGQTLEAAGGRGAVDAAETELAVAKAKVAAAEALVQVGGDIQDKGFASAIGRQTLEGVQQLMAGMGFESMKGETFSQAQLRKAKEALEIAKQEAAERQKTLSIAKKKLETEEAAEAAIRTALEENASNADNLRDQLEAIEARAEEARMKAEAAGAKRGALTGIGMGAQPLSSQAKSGLAGNEIQTAMNSLAVARDMLAQLKLIARNTGRKQEFVWT